MPDPGLLVGVDAFRRMMRGMRRWLGIAIVFLCAVPFAQAQPLAKSTAERVALVAPGADYEYLVHKAQQPAARFAAIALHDLEKAHNPASAARRPLALEPSPAPPTDWLQIGLGPAGADRGQGPAPLASKEGTEPCRCKTVVGDSERHRISALYLSHSFSLPQDTDLSKFQMIELRVAYKDGLNAYLNGVPIASRNLGTWSPSPTVVGGKLALRKRGPEWETFSVPLRPALLKRGKNLLSFEVRPSANRQGVRFDASLTLRTAGKIVRGPIIQQVSSTRALLLFDTDLPTRAHLSYGATKELGKRVASVGGGLARHHRFELKDLKPGQVVHYRAEPASGPLAIQRFHLASASSDPLRFAVYGDMRGGHTVHGKIIKSLLEEAIDFVIVTGDLVLRGSDEADWQRFFDVAAPLLARLPYYPVAGNHDTGRTGDERLRMNEIFALWPGPSDRPNEGHWYSFDVAGVHFVMLDSNNYRNSSQRSWLEKDLRAAKAAGARAIFAAVHAGPYSRGLHRGHRYAAETYAPVLAAHKVTLLFSGHDHLYQRGKVKGLNYMVSGGGGAPLYSVRCGVRGKKRCKANDGMQHVAKENHYILVTVYPRHVEACPKRVDRSPLEACVRYPLPRVSRASE